MYVGSPVALFLACFGVDELPKHKQQCKMTLSIHGEAEQQQSPERSTQDSIVKCSDAVPQLPDHIVLHIFSLLPDPVRAWSARLVSKAAYIAFHSSRVISLSSTDLPLTALQEAYYHAYDTSYDTPTAACSSPRPAVKCIRHGNSMHIDPEKQQQKLAAARAACGDLRGLQWLLSQSCPVGVTVCSRAAAGGHLAVLQWARSQKHPCPWDSSTCICAAEAGHLDVLQWARAQKPPCPWDSRVCSHAAKYGQVAVLQWARSQHPPCPWDSDVCQYAAQAGQLAVLQWARAQNPPCHWNSRVCSYAARGGRLAILQWARAQHPPCPWDSSVCSAAAKAGHLHIIKWAREQTPPCPWDSGLCRYACRGGQLAVLQWARAQDPPCPWNKRLCEQEAEALGHHHVVEWLLTVED